jgi:hypothetical protein
MRGVRFVVSHPVARNHPIDEDLSMGTPVRRQDGVRGWIGEASD